jgi:hypothetical protein
MVPNSTLLRLPVRVCVTWAMNCFATRSFKPTPGRLWKSWPRHASKMLHASEHRIVRAPRECRWCG